jgi:hypothetical protein
VVFEEHPGAGWLAVPGTVADRVAAHGLRGEAFFPDMSTSMGRAAMAKLSAVSRAAERRPLCNDVPGVRSVAISEGRVVLTHAKHTEGGIAVVAAPQAVSPAAQVTPFVAPAYKAQAATEPAKPNPAPRMRM